MNICENCTRQFTGRIYWTEQGRCACSIDCREAINSPRKKLHFGKFYRIRYGTQATYYGQVVGIADNIYVKDEVYPHIGKGDILTTLYTLDTGSGKPHQLADCHIIESEEFTPDLERPRKSHKHPMSYCSHCDKFLDPENDIHREDLLYYCSEHCRDAGPYTGRCAGCRLPLAPESECIAIDGRLFCSEQCVKIICSQ